MTTDQKIQRIIDTLNLLKSCKPYDIEHYNGLVKGLIEAWGGDCSISCADIQRYTAIRIRFYDEKRGAK